MIVKIVLWSVVSIYLLTIVYATVKHTNLINWIVNTLKYPYRKRKVTKLFKILPAKKKRDAWLNATVVMDESKWYNRALEKYVRTKFIEPILNTDGSVRIN